MPSDEQKKSIDELTRAIGILNSWAEGKVCVENSLIVFKLSVSASNNIKKLPRLKKESLRLLGITKEGGIINHEGSQNELSGNTSLVCRINPAELCNNRDLKDDLENIRPLAFWFWLKSLIKKFFGIYEYSPDIQKVVKLVASMPKRRSSFSEVGNVPVSIKGEESGNDTPKFVNRSIGEVKGQEYKKEDTEGKNSQRDELDSSFSDYVSIFLAQDLKSGENSSIPTIVPNSGKSTPKFGGK